MSQLSTFERRWAIAAFEAIFPGYDETTSITKMDADRYVDDVCGSVPFKAFIGFRLAIWVVTFAPLFVIGRLALLKSLGLSDRTKVLSTLIASNNYAIRQLVMMFKAIGAMLFAAHPAIRSRMMKPRPAKRELVQLRVGKTSHAA